MAKRLRECRQCHYPYAGPDCTNPACYANPRVSEEVKTRWRAETALRESQEADRLRLQRLREQSLRLC